ncbi:PREDICTED: inactive protein RESTRICTED TEV MOVEMENT 1-like [Nicotiana attenuata]|uniref:inactive protein RESTRICTED TEV MOVEMENT 1-like n=1 Tax=Nicotiana attenuata TaxID=49451 RepID=UPI000905BE2E|nr:PREDICTED: inactive protein RESTRICTED TEV MOVEMENT 1-like [Nicotiana attenuata]
MIKVCPFIGLNGEIWDDKEDKVVKIFISHGRRVNFIQFLFIKNGSFVLSNKHGGDGGLKFDTIKLDYPSEFITWIRGYYVEFHPTVIQPANYVTSITFGTNKATYGPFGSHESSDIEFDFQFGTDGAFGGFHGTTHIHYLESIGVYIKPITCSTIVENREANNSNVS